MIPQERLSSTNLPGPFLGARNSSEINNRYDLEDGGVALQDTSEGLFYQVWHAYINDFNTAILVGPEGGSDTTLITGTNITEVSLTFDRNMNVAIAYVENGEAKLNWFDLIANDQITTNFGPTVINPRVSHDDKHPLASDTSDVLFAYLKNGSLYYRQQRDRYAVEKLLATPAELAARGASGPLWKVGMGTNNRFQFQFRLS